MHPHRHWTTPRGESKDFNGFAREHPEFQQSQAGGVFPSDGDDLTELANL